MPRSRSKKKKNPHLQVIKESEYITKDYNGKPMRVKNPRYGKERVIKHRPQEFQHPDKDFPSDGG